MADTKDKVTNSVLTVKEKAEKDNRDLDVFLKLLNDAGMSKTADSEITESEIQKLVEYLQGSNASADSDDSIASKPKKLTLKRRSKEKEITDSTGKKRKVKVVVVKSKEKLAKDAALKAAEKAKQEEELRKKEEVHKRQEEEAKKQKVLEEDKVKKEADELENKVLEEKIKEKSKKENVVEDKEITTDESEKKSEVSKEKTDKSQKDKFSKEKPSITQKKEVDADEEEQERKRKLNKGKKKPASNKELDVQKIDIETVKELEKDLEEEERKEKIAKAKSFEEQLRERKIKEYSEKTAHRFVKPVSKTAKEILIPESISVSDLAHKLSIRSNIIIKKLMGMGVMATVNQEIDSDTAGLIIEELGHSYKLENQVDLDQQILSSIDNADVPEESRPPVVTIMGHVDHGKTSLLDYIRRTKVTEKEAGGITQHIGAYSVNVDKGSMTFLDTPGHAAFSAMRSRGANCTDIVILVVAADDGVMPQTVEAIQHAKAAKVPMIVAVNKIDKPDADVERIKTDLSNHGVIPEDWGGDTQFVALSAKSGEGVDELLEAILLQSEMLELKAKKATPARGIIIESRVDKGRGAVASLLVQAGTLKKGDIVVAGSEYGRIRAMQDAAGKALSDAEPSTPVEVLGLSGTPNAGDIFVVVSNEKTARELVELKESYVAKQKTASQSVSLENLFDGAGHKIKVLNVIIKADVQGSVEAISDQMNKMANDEVKVNVVGTGVGGINESDITLSMASNAVILGFNVRAVQAAKKLAEQEGVKILYHSIIYNIIDDVKAMLSGMLDPEVREEIIGLAEVRDVFKSSKFGAVAGCMVADGVIKRNNPIRVLRNNVVIYEGELESLRRFKDDVQEVRNGMECGIAVKNYNDVKSGDQIEVFERTVVDRTFE